MTKVISTDLIAKGPVISDKVAPDDISFIYQYGILPVCKSFTSRDFSIVSKGYDFANPPPHHTCSSEERLVTVKSQRKLQAFPCPMSNAFPACSFYKFNVEKIKTASFNDAKVSFIKIDYYDTENETKITKYIICSFDKKIVYMSYDSDDDNQSNEKIFDKWVKEAAFGYDYNCQTEQVQEKSEEIKPKKVSYFSRLISNFISS